MKASFALAALALAAGGCAAGFGNPTGLSSVASALGEVGATATGFKSTESTVKLNDANKDLLEAQAAVTQAQLNDAQAEHQRIAHERVVTAKLLRNMSDAYHEPVFLTLAEWVEAGGDPDFAFKYALNHIESDARTKVIPQQQPAVALALPIQPATASPLALKAASAPSVAANSAAAATDAGTPNAALPVDNAEVVNQR
ncbi:MAG TPA: hypothetical protein VFB15_08530 [Candidatus Binataceae bacterium]|jgi:hypothetical protein|nr:hypothetical protein [Candidatus Binataceae bacterium]